MTEVTEPADRSSTRHRIPTFKPRRRQLSASRAALMERLAPVLCLEPTGPRLDLTDVFGREAPVVLDIGIGGGEALIESAQAEPDVDVIGVDVHTPGIAASLAAIDELGLANVRLVHGDALRFVERLDDGALDGIRIFFPDPWPKAKHRQRRLVNETRLDEFARLLTVGGRLHVATDIDDYATWTKRLCEGHPAFVGGVVARPAARPRTRYERKGLDAGRTVTDLIYRRR